MRYTSRTCRELSTLCGLLTHARAPTLPAPALLPCLLRSLSVSLAPLSLLRYAALPRAAVAAYLLTSWWLHGLALFFTGARKTHFRTIGAGRCLMLSTYTLLFFNTRAAPRVVLVMGGAMTDLRGSRKEVLGALFMD